MTKYNAVIQTYKNTGVNRVFYRKRINGETKIVCTHPNKINTYKVTGYRGLANVIRDLTDTLPVYKDECVMLLGEDVTAKLGIERNAQAKANAIIHTREHISQIMGVSWAEAAEALRSAA